MSVKLIYKDIALGADIGADITTPALTTEPFTNPDRILKDDTAPAIATLEHNGWGLNGRYKVLDNQRLAFWSRAQSDKDAVLSPQPKLSIQFADLIASTGITIRFAPESMDFARAMRVTWYKQGASVATGLYYPAKPLYVVDKTIDSFDRLDFSFILTSLPYKRLKIESITVGVVRELGEQELTSLSLINEIDPISSSAPANVLDASIHASDSVNYIFQRKQPVEAYDGDSLIGIYYIEKGKRTSGNDYRISCHDKVGLLELMSQNGGIWFEDTPLTDIIEQIFGDDVYIELDPAFKNSTLRGYIEAGTMRSALQQIAFALGAVIDTSGSTGIRLFPLPLGNGTEIPLKKTYTGGSVETSDVVTEVTVTAYIIFDERPESGDQSLELNGVKYRYYTDTKHAVNTDAPKGAPENKKKFDKMYLCNNSNAQALADSIMEYYKRRNSYTFKHVISGEQPAGRHSVGLPWGNTVNGNVRKMSISVSGLTVSNTEMLLDA